jgi:hypothetical protein
MEYASIGYARFASSYQRTCVILASMIIRGVATFGLMVYTLANFARWLIEDSQMDDDYSEDNLNDNPLIDARALTDSNVIRVSMPSPRAH